MLREYEYIYAVYQERSFSKAAARLYVSQPALSSVVKKIEAELNITLFNRSSNPIQLTPAGAYYIQCVEKILQIESDMRNYLNELATEKHGTITVASAAFFVAHVLPSIIEDFQALNPGLRVNLLEVNALDLEKCLSSGTADFVLCVDSLDTSLYQKNPWQREYILLAVPASFKINDQLEEYRFTSADINSGRYLSPDVPAVDIEHFREYPFLFLRKGNDMYTRGLKICRNAGFAPDIAMDFDQLLTSYYVSQNGKGIAFIRDGIPRHVTPSLDLFFYKINDPNAVRDVFIYSKKTAKLSVGAQRLIKHIQQESPRL